MTNKTTKNILHITTSKGGVEYYINSIISESKAFIHYYAVPHAFRTVNKQYLVVFNSFHIPLVRDMLNIYNIKKNINKSKIKFNLIHGHSSKGILYSCVIGLLCNIPVIASPHAFGFYRFKGIKRLFIATTEYLIYNIFPCYLLPSNNSERIIGGKRFFIKRKTIKENYYNSLKLTNYKKIKDIKKNNLKIVFVGRITYQKNPEKYLLLAKKIKKSNPDVNCLLVGAGFDGKLMSEERLFNEKAENVLSIIDWVSKSDLITILQESDIYISTSRYEGLPTSTLLAMNYELPIVTTKTPGNEDLVINGYNGFLSNDLNILEEKIQLLINNNALRLEFGKNSKIFLEEHHNIDKNIITLEKIYNSLIR